MHAWLPITFFAAMGDKNKFLAAVAIGIRAAALSSRGQLLVALTQNYLKNFKKGEMEKTKYELHYYTCSQD